MIKMSKWIFLYKIWKRPIFPIYGASLFIGAAINKKLLSILKGGIMLNSRILRNMAIIAITAKLTARGVRATENEPNGLVMEFVRIPAGSFDMGSPSSEKDRLCNEGPVHEVHITKPCYMGKYEVTQAQWKAVMGTTVKQQHDKANWPWLLRGEGPDYPIYYVQWEEAVEFCKRLGDDFRLPTEAEWEYACRAGTQTRFYYGDDPDYSELGEYAWYYGNSHNTAHPVGQKKPNAMGLYDMYGNVSEWCSDWFMFTDSYKNAESIDPTGPESGDMFHIIRGGNWLEKPQVCRSASRNFGFWPDEIGFRVVFTGYMDNDKKVMEITVPKEPHKVVNEQEQKDEVKLPGGSIINGVIRDEAGIPIDGAEMQFLPNNDWLRQYAEGEFEAFWFNEEPGEIISKRHFIARHVQRNLAAVVEFGEDVNSLDIRLKPAMILSGKVVDSDGKGIKGAQVVTKLQAPDWYANLLPLVIEADTDGNFEIRAVPPGYKYTLIVRDIGHIVKQIEVDTNDVHNNRIEIDPIVMAVGKLSVSGLVVDVNDKPVAHAWVYCTSKGIYSRNSLTDANGKFKVDGINEGPVQVTAYLWGNNPSKVSSGSVDTEAGATDVKVVLNKIGPPPPNSAPPPKGRACFPAGTDVWVNGVLVPIDRVFRGQTVGKVGCIAYKTAFGQIQDIEEHAGIFEYREITLKSGNHIDVVDAHCFMLDSGQWVAAQNLRSGLRLKTINGTVAIKSVTSSSVPFIGKVYNLKIRNSDLYMVGKDGLIVRDF